MNVDLAATRLVEFKRELEDKIKHHQNLRRLDASFHRLLIIGAVVSGCLSLVKMADDWAKTTNAQSLDLTIEKAH